jgi:hypothetical protein
MVSAMRGLSRRGDLQPSKEGGPRGSLLDLGLGAACLSGFGANIARRFTKPNFAKSASTMTKASDLPDPIRAGFLDRIIQLASLLRLLANQINQRDPETKPLSVHTAI